MMFNSIHDLSCVKVVQMSKFQIRGESAEIMPECDENFV